MHNSFVLNFRSAATIRNDSDAKVYKIVLKFRLLPPPPVENVKERRDRSNMLMNLQVQLRIQHLIYFCYILSELA